MKLAFVIEEVEMKAKNAKNEIARVEGEKYFEFKTNGTGKNTENTIQSNVDERRRCSSCKIRMCQTRSKCEKMELYYGYIKESSYLFPQC